MIRRSNWLCWFPLLTLFVGCSERGHNTIPSTDDPNGTRNTAGVADTFELAPPPRELIFLEVTPEAAQEVGAAARESNLGRWWLRYEMIPGGCQGFRHNLALDAGPPKAGEFEFQAGGVTCLLLENQRHLVQGVRIDFGTREGKRGFLVTAPHASAQTKDAVSKWVMDEFHKRNPEFASQSEK